MSLDTVVKEIVYPRILDSDIDIDIEPVFAGMYIEPAGRKVGITHCRGVAADAILVFAVDLAIFDQQSLAGEPATDNCVGKRAANLRAADDHTRRMDRYTAVDELAIYHGARHADREIALHEGELGSLGYACVAGIRPNGDGDQRRLLRRAISPHGRRWRHVVRLGAVLSSTRDRDGDYRQKSD
jgi:hypothetical protein